MSAIRIMRAWRSDALRWPCSIRLRRTDAGRPRARDLGIAPGALTPGRSTPSPTSPACASGHITLVDGDTVRTGVTAILPHGGNLFQDKVAGAVFVGNAFGKLAGSTQVQELGTIETPIVLTNTLSVGTAMDAVVRWTLAPAGNESVRSVNALVGETNDGGLNDIRGLHVTREHVIARDRRREGGPVDGRRRRRRHRHDRLRLERRHRHLVADGPQQGHDTWTVGVLVQSELRRQAR